MPKSREAASFGRVSHDEHLTRPAGKTAGDVDALSDGQSAAAPDRIANGHMAFGARPGSS